MKAKFYATLLLAGISLFENVSAQEVPIDRGITRFGDRAHPDSSAFGSTSIGYFALNRGSVFSGLSTAVGYRSLAANEFGERNTALGGLTLEKNVRGEENTAIGYSALAENIGGVENTSVGAFSSLLSQGSFNTAIGYRALYANTTGQSNTGVGHNALVNSSNHGGNTAIGKSALQSPGGSFNVALGFQAAASGDRLVYTTAIGADALFQARAPYNTAIGGRASAFNTTGTNNVSLGYSALSANTTGSRNVVIGALAVTKYSVSDAVVIGQGTSLLGANFVNVVTIGSGVVATASHQVRLGNNSTTSIGGRVGWSTVSDGRVKEDIKENVPGLELINKLRPVTYLVNRGKLNQLLNVSPENNNGEAEKRQTGFIAQDVAKTAEELQFEFSGVDAPKNDKDLYGLRYAEFVVPLVKAVQELSQLVKEQQEQIEELKRNIGSGTAKSGAWIKQNTPNPVSSSTSIEYFIPNEVRAARILVTNAKGQQLKIYNVSGSGTVQFSVGTLPAGTYTYSLVADGRTVSAKKMIVVLK